MSQRVLKVLLSITCVFGFAIQASAATTRPVIAQASGQIMALAPCPSFPVFCQTAVVTGSATQLGAFVGVLNETVNIATGTYTGTATFTTTNGDTILTEYTGTLSPPDQQGRVFFVEDHVVDSGTGKFSGATGGLHVFGIFDTTTGKIQIVGVGTLTR
jgi:hypothetical protein